MTLAEAVALAQNEQRLETPHDPQRAWPDLVVARQLGASWLALGKDPFRVSGWAMRVRSGLIDLSHRSDRLLPAAAPCATEPIWADGGCGPIPSKVVVTRIDRRFGDQPA